MNGRGNDGGSTRACDLEITEAPVGRWLVVRTVSEEEAAHTGVPRRLVGSVLADLFEALEYTLRQIDRVPAVIAAPKRKAPAVWRTVPRAHAGRVFELEHCADGRVLIWTHLEGSDRVVSLGWLHPAGIAGDAPATALLAAFAGALSSTGAAVVERQALVAQLASSAT